MPVTIIQGDAATAATDGILSNRRKVEMRDEIFLLEPSAAPLTLLMNRLGRRAVGNPTHEWLESEATPITDRINSGGGYTAGATSIVVDNGAYFFDECLFRVQRTGEVIKVASVTGNNLGVTSGRSWGGTAVAAIVDNDQLTILGGAAVENSAAEASRQVQKVRGYNVTQIFRDPFGASNTLIASDLYGGNYMSVEAKERGIEHAKYIELAMFFGERAEVTSGDTPQRSMGGIDEWITTYSEDFGGFLSLEMLFDFAEDAFRYGRKRKMLFVGRSVASNISLLAADKLQTVPADRTFGIAVETLRTPHGEWNIVSHDLFEGDEYSLSGFSVDMDALGYVYMRGRDTTLFTNIQAPDVDGQKNEYLTECGLERIHQRRCAKFTDGAV